MLQIICSTPREQPQGEQSQEHLDAKRRASESRERERQEHAIDVERDRRGSLWSGVKAVRNTAWRVVKTVGKFLWKHKWRILIPVVPVVIMTVIGTLGSIIAGAILSAFVGAILNTIVSELSSKTLPTRTHGGTAKEPASEAAAFIPGPRSESASIPQKSSQASPRHPLSEEQGVFKDCLQELFERDKT